MTQNPRMVVVQSDRDWAIPTGAEAGVEEPLPFAG